jgi:hypothetical protein
MPIQGGLAGRIQLGFGRQALGEDTADPHGQGAAHVQGAGDQDHGVDAHGAQQRGGALCVVRWRR